ncbi:MarR family winged helix-turn-helix transcriptional regulator [Nocardia cyriacigeorgica]|uniref:Multiple antibiotic resistance protein marR n=1 Tax=Nocardia cyriacigeorgica TaxID=135487 RepID=A0A4V6ICN0_9NOCA|nr:MarR family winged helix-turn-helix transcriptional regulator [Nocardia cyriacigeorgica]VFA99603.1 Multiple antibiotic resistance protein marR [Nocardia cyriacigeorgica]
MPDRPDLAAMIVPLGRTLMALERPILESHGLTMWAYGVLLGLEESPVRTQSALAQAIGADKTRIIPILDDLQERGLITRVPDPADRRARLLSLTPAGRELRDRTRAAIRQQEEELLSTLPADDRRGLLRALRQLADRRPENTGA